MIGDACAICSEPIREHDRVADRLLGWVPRRRSGGGAHSIRATIGVGQIAHDRCVDEIVAGHRPQPEAEVQWQQQPLPLF